MVITKLLDPVAILILGRHAMNTALLSMQMPGWGGLPLEQGDQHKKHSPGFFSLGEATSLGEGKL